MMKRLQPTLLTLAFLIPFIGCGGDSFIKLPKGQEFQYATPENLTGTAGYHSVTLSWDAVENAEYYVLFYGTTEEMVGTGGIPADSGEVLTAGTSQKISHLETDVEYYFAVVAEGSAGLASEKSEHIAAKTLKITEIQQEEEDPADLI